MHGEGYIKTSVTLPGSIAGSALGGNFNDTTDGVISNETVNIDSAAGNPALMLKRAGVTQSFINDSGSNIAVVSNGAGTAGMFITHGASAWTAISDARLPWKKTAREITNTLPSLDGFHLYENEVDGRLELFVKAQEFHAIAPHMVTVGSDDPEYVPTGIQDENVWAVSYDRAGVLALAYIKKLKNELRHSKPSNVAPTHHIAG